MPGADDFERRTRTLAESVGYNDIVAGCEVDQPYAQDQHETLHYRHDDGGRARYLGGPLMENAFSTMQELARRCITEFGSGVQPAMIDLSEKLAGYVRDFAPVETTALRNSGSPYVVDNGVEIYDRPPLAPRERD